MSEDYDRTKEEVSSILNSPLHFPTLEIVFRSHGKFRHTDRQSPVRLDSSTPDSYHLICIIGVVSL